MGLKDGDSLYQYVGSAPSTYVDALGLARGPYPQNKCSDDRCCCCPEQLHVAVLNKTEANRQYGVKLQVTAVLRYQRKARGVRVNRDAEECHLNWYEWSDKPVWYGGGKTEKWLSIYDYPTTLDSPVFDEWIEKPRPTNCSPTRRYEIDFIDEPMANNVHATYRAVAYIAIRVRGSFGCNCRNNDAYAVLKLHWRGDGNAPVVTKTNRSGLQPTPGLPHPHF